MRLFKMHKYARSLVFLILFSFLSLGASAQSGLQSPSDFLGYELGGQWTPHHKVMDYFRHVAEHSPKVEAETYGITNEGSYDPVIARPPDGWRIPW